jgi:hypothetical protein
MALLAIVKQHACTKREEGEEEDNKKVFTGIQHSCLAVGNFDLRTNERTEEEEASLKVRHARKTSSSASLPSNLPPPPTLKPTPKLPLQGFPSKIV